MRLSLRTEGRRRRRWRRKSNKSGCQHQLLVASKVVDTVMLRGRMWRCRDTTTKGTSRNGPCHEENSRRQPNSGERSGFCHNGSRPETAVQTRGVTGESILYKLYDLCGFDPVQDLAVDVMHSLVLNLIRSELEHSNS